MGMQKLTLRPGVNLQRTGLLNEGGWSAANLIRFYEEMPEVYGGWTALGTMALSGVPRAAHAWATLAGMPTLAVGTSSMLGVIQGTTLADITPIINTTTPTNPFTTTNGSAIVAVSDPLAAGPIVGQIVIISGATAVGGLTLSGNYTIASVSSATAYTITAASQATSGATGGGTPTLQYLLAPGRASATLLYGWGVGPYGSGTWGTPRSASTLYGQPRTWTLGNFGDQLIACPRGQGIFLWIPEKGLGARATPIATAIAQANAIFIANGAEQVIALGGVPADGGAGAAAQPMLVSWCNSGDYTDWIASATNSAGNYPLTDGSQLMWGANAGLQNLIWSDTALYSMQYIGGTSVWGFTQLGTACGMISPQSAVVVNGTVALWMSNLNFMSYNGTVQPIDCPVRDIVFKNLDTTQAWKISASLNSQFNEVRWDYPSLDGAGECDSYVIFNYANNTWTYGSDQESSLLAGQEVLVARPAWQDVSVFGDPIGFDADGNAWQHEVENVYSAGTLAMPWMIESGYIDISPGEDIMFLDWIIPDQVMSGGTVDLTLSAQRYSADTPVTLTGAFTPSTESLNMRLRGRQIAATFQSAGSTPFFWRLGAVRFRAVSDGRN